MQTLMSGPPVVLPQGETKWLPVSYADSEARFPSVAVVDQRRARIAARMSFPSSFYFPGWFCLVLNLKVFLPARTPWRPGKTRRRCGCSGGTAAKRFAVRASGSWRRTRRKGRRRTGTSSATTGEAACGPQGAAPKGPRTSLVLVG